MTRFQKIWSLFLNVVFPPACLVCGRRGENALCRECSLKIELHNSFFCPECNRRLPAAELLKTKNLCHPETKFILAAAAPYENKVVRELIHALKYNRAKTALKPLGEIINKYLEKVMRNSELSARSGSTLGGEIRNFIIVPLPLHPRKEKERGFNQAELIAGIMNKELGIMVRKNNLIRTKETKSQTETKDYEERQKNVSGAFALVSPEKVAGQNIILVDDVFTSGATMGEAVKVLKAAGARKIIGFVIAKT